MAGQNAKKYSVQVGTFTVQDNAARLESELRLKGYEPYTKEDLTAGNAVYRVLVGQFGDRSAAEMTRLGIIAQERIKAVIHESEML